MLHAANRLRDLSVPPGNRLEKLRGDRKGQHSIRVIDRWRICFIWRDGDAYDVEITVRAKLIRLLPSTKALLFASDSIKAAASSTRSL